MTSPPLPGIGFLGVGAMGGHMVKHLLRAGYRVQAFDLNPTRLQNVAAAGAILCADATECVTQSDWVLASLPSSDAFVQTAEKVLLPYAREGQIFIDFGTTIPRETRRLAAQFEQKGASLLDAPVSGGEWGAERGQLKMFVGGAQSTYDQVRPLLETIGGGHDLHFCGPSGAGQMVKGVNQLLMGLLAAGCLEALSFGVRGGVPSEVLLAALDGPEAWRGHFARIAKQVIEEGGENAGVKFRELPYFLREAQEQNIPLPLTEELWSFCDKGERVVVDDNRPAPSFWHELMKDIA